MDNSTPLRIVAGVALLAVLALPLQALACADAVELCPMQTQQRAPDCHGPEPVEPLGDCCISDPAPVPTPAAGLVNAPSAVELPAAVTFETDASVAPVPARDGLALPSRHPGVPLHTLLVTFLN